MWGRMGLFSVPQDLAGVSSATFPALVTPVAQEGKVAYVGLIGGVEVSLEEAGDSLPAITFSEAASEAATTAACVAWNAVMLGEEGLCAMLGPRKGQPLSSLSPFLKLHPAAVVWEGSSLGLAFFMSMVAKLWGLQLLPYALSAELDLLGNLHPVKGISLKAQAAKDAGLRGIITNIYPKAERRDLSPLERQDLAPVRACDVWEALEVMVVGRRLLCSASEWRLLQTSMGVRF